MPDPIPFVATQSGPSQDAPSGSIPIAAYGFGGGDGGFPASSPNGSTGVDLTNDGFVVVSVDGLKFLVSKDRLSVANPEDYQNFSVNNIGDNVFVQISSSGPLGFISLNGDVRALVPIVQQAGTATAPNHLVTKQYVDNAIAAALA